MTVRAFPNFDALLGALRGGDAKFVVVIGLWGSANPNQPYHLDVLVSREPENLERVAAALAPFAPRPRGSTMSDVVPFGAPLLESETNHPLTTERGEIDLLGELPGGLKHDDVYLKSLVIKLFGHAVRCLDYPAYIREMSETRPPEDEDLSIEDLEAEVERRIARKSGEYKAPEFPPEGGAGRTVARVEPERQSGEGAAGVAIAEERHGEWTAEPHAEEGADPALSDSLDLEPEPDPEDEPKAAAPASEAVGESAQAAEPAEEAAEESACQAEEEPAFDAKDGLAEEPKDEPANGAELRAEDEENREG